MADLSHFDKNGKAHMVDVSSKAITHRIAMAKGRVKMARETFDTIAKGTAQKGDVLGVARIAGIMAAKKTPEIIPLCHPLPLSKITIGFTLEHKTNSISICSTVKTNGQTGVEMEALHATTTAALTIYDMLKAIDKHMQITDIRVTLKEGGKSGRIETK